MRSQSKKVMSLAIIAQENKWRFLLISKKLAHSGTVEDDARPFKIKIN